MLEKREQRDYSKRDEFKGQLKKGKHHIIKLVIALIVIPTTTTILDAYILRDMAPIYLSMFISTWATFILLSMYDGIVTRETQRAKDQIIENTLSIIVIEEDVKDLQKEVYKGHKEEVRAQNYAKAMRRRGEAYKGGVFNETKSNN